MSDYHEPYDALDEETRDAHRALTSLKEEIEAVDWYHQRVALCRDPDLRAVLAHNRDEEVEHACMALEWLRRRVPRWDDMLKRYLFTEGPIQGEGDQDTDAPPEESGAVSAGRDLGVGSLRANRATGKES